MNLAFIPTDCPVCGDAVKWTCGLGAIPPESWPAGLGIPAGTAIFDFTVTCHKQESRSLKSVHGTCLWGFRALGTFTRSAEDPKRLDKAQYLTETVALSPIPPLAHRKYPEGRVVREYEQTPVVFLDRSACEAALEPLLRILSSRGTISELYPDEPAHVKGAAISAVRYLAAVLRTGAHPDSLLQRTPHVLHFGD